jgi:lipid-A-disaccharide synthase-like uncharacterized protein
MSKERYSSVLFLVTNLNLILAVTTDFWPTWWWVMIGSIGVFLFGLDHLVEYLDKRHLEEETKDRT